MVSLARVSLVSLIVTLSASGICSLLRAAGFGEFWGVIPAGSLSAPTPRPPLSPPPARQRRVGCPQVPAALCTSILLPLCISDQATLTSLPSDRRRNTVRETRSRGGTVCTKEKSAPPSSTAARSSRHHSGWASPGAGTIPEKEGRGKGREERSRDGASATSSQGVWAALRTRLQKRGRGRKEPPGSVIKSHA